MMNTSSNTKANLKAASSVMGSPLTLIPVKQLLLIIVALGLLLILVKLGFWQLARADEKERLHTELLQRQSQSPINYQQLISTPETKALTGIRIEVEAVPIANKLILLDNQVYQGQVGYLAYQLLRVPNYDTRLLLELGFIIAPKDRRLLPQVELLQHKQNFSGRLYQKSINPLSPNLLPESGWPLRIQNLALTELAQHLDTPLAPAVLQAANLESTLPHPWRPIPMSAQKHRGYALQWFSLALALVILLGYGFWKCRPTTRLKHREQQR